MKCITLRMNELEKGSRGHTYEMPHISHICQSNVTHMQCNALNGIRSNSAQRSDIFFARLDLKPFTSHIEVIGGLGGEEMIRSKKQIAGKISGHGGVATTGKLLMVGLGISRTNADSRWNPVYNVFHRNFVVETKRFVGSFVHVILTRQTCVQRSSRAAESQRRAIGNYFSERIFYMFLISKCRGD